MITINRVMNPNPLNQMEQLPVLLFEGEVNAHRFIIEPMAGMSFTGYDVTARFVRADQQSVAPEASLEDGNACVILSPSCYAVGGPYKLYIYIENDSETICVYACSGIVVSTVGANGQAGDVTTPIIDQYSSEDLAAHFPQTGRFVTGAGSVTKNYATAMGDHTTASGEAAHSEGHYSIASGDFSHAEGWSTEASGTTAHSEGTGTIATHRSQHVGGEYNEEDPSSSAATNRGTYAEVIGNGTGPADRSNARTLDWAGNEALAGALTLGATGEDEATITPAQLRIIKTGIDWLFFLHRYEVVATSEHGYNKCYGVIVYEYEPSVVFFADHPSRTFAWDNDVGKWCVDDGEMFLTASELENYGIYLEEYGPDNCYDAFTITRMDQTATYQNAMKTMGGINSLIGNVGIEDALAAASLRNWWKSKTSTVTYHGLTLALAFNYLTINGTWNASDYVVGEMLDLTNDMALFNTRDCHMIMRGGHDYRMIMEYQNGTSELTSDHFESSPEVTLIAVTGSSYYAPPQEDEEPWDYTETAFSATLSHDVGSDNVYPFRGDYELCSLCFVPPKAHDNYPDAVWTFTNYEVKITIADVTGLGFARGGGSYHPSEPWRN